jgi:hypothetical protein
LTNCPRSFYAYFYSFLYRNWYNEQLRGRPISGQSLEALLKEFRETGNVVIKASDGRRFEFSLKEARSPNEGYVVFVKDLDTVVNGLPLGAGFILIHLKDNSQQALLNTIYQPEFNDTILTPHLPPAIKVDEPYRSHYRGIGSILLVLAIDNLTRRQGITQLRVEEALAPGFYKRVFEQLGMDFNEKGQPSRPNFMVNLQPISSEQIANLMVITREDRYYPGTVDQEPQSSVDELIYVLTRAGSRGIGDGQQALRSAI